MTSHWHANRESFGLHGLLPAVNGALLPGSCLGPALHPGVSSELCNGPFSSSFRLPTFLPEVLPGKASPPACLLS